MKSRKGRRTCDIARSAGRRVAVSSPMSSQRQVDAVARDHEDDVSHLALRDQPVGARGVVDRHVPGLEQRFLAVLEQQAAAAQLQGELVVVAGRTVDELGGADDRVPGDPDVEHGQAVDVLRPLGPEGPRTVRLDLQRHEALRDVVPPRPEVGRRECRRPGP